MRIAQSVLIAAVSALVACSRSPIAPSPPAVPLGETRETSNYVFHYSAGDSVDADWQEKYHAWLIATLQVSVPERITYNKYISRTHMGDLTGRFTTDAFAESSSFRIHTISNRDNHEVVHVCSALFGGPVAFFEEGLAVAMQTDPAAADFVPRVGRQTPVHDYTRQLRKQGQLIALDALLTSTEFRRFDSKVTYPEAGSFVRYLFETYGLAPLKLLFQRGTSTDSADAVRRQFIEVYARSIADAERDWWGMLDAR